MISGRDLGVARACLREFYDWCAKNAKFQALFPGQTVYKSRGGGYSNYFLTGCAARGLKPLPIFKDFSPSKNG